MRYLLFNWVLSAVSLVIVAALVPGIEIEGFGTAMIAAVVIGLFNVTLGLLLVIATFSLAIITFAAFLFLTKHPRRPPLKIAPFPLTPVPFGAFLIVINALMLKVAASVMPGFKVRGC